MENGLLDTPGWRSLNRIAICEKLFNKMLKQSKLQSQRHGKHYKFGVLVPKSHEEAVGIDKENGNSLWQDAVKLEMDQIDEYNTFIDLGKGAKPPDGYQHIPVHVIFDVKQSLK